MDIGDTIYGLCGAGIIDLKEIQKTKVYTKEIEPKEIKGIIINFSKPMQLYVVRCNDTLYTIKSNKVYFLKPCLLIEREVVNV